MAGVVLDASPLIAVERDKQLLKTLLTVASEEAEPLLVSSATVAEVWRGGRRSAPIGQLLGSVEVVALDYLISRRAGELLAAVRPEDARRSAPTIDAIVVAVAAARSCDILTGDRKDIAPLAEHLGVKVRLFTRP